MLMSVLIIKDTRNPENDSMYSTTRAGIMSEIKKSMQSDYQESHNIDQVILESALMVANVISTSFFF